MIDKLSDQEKSVMLAKAMGKSPQNRQAVPDWMIEIPGIARNDKELESVVFNLYDPENMALAWRVLNWVNYTPLSGAWNVWFYDQLWMWVPPADAQRKWLDKVLELAIEAGLVELEKEKMTKRVFEFAYTEVK